MSVSPFPSSSGKDSASEAPRIALASDPVEMEVARGLFVEYAQELGVDLCFQGFAEELRSLPGAYAPPRGRLLLAWRGDEAVGCVALRPLTDSACEVKRLYVKPSCRRAGVGRLLAARIIAEAKRAGYRRMLLDTLAQMGPALRLYEELGFRQCPAYYANPLPGVVYLELNLEA